MFRPKQTNILDKCRNKTQIILFLYCYSVVIIKLYSKHIYNQIIYYTLELRFTTHIKNNYLRY